MTTQWNGWTRAKPLEPSAHSQGLLDWLGALPPSLIDGPSKERRPAPISNPKISLPGILRPRKRKRSAEKATTPTTYQCSTPRTLRAQPVSHTPHKPPSPMLAPSTPPCIPFDQKHVIMPASVSPLPPLPPPPAPKHSGILCKRCIRSPKPEVVCLDESLPNFHRDTRLHRLQAQPVADATQQQQSAKDLRTRLQEAKKLIEWAREHKLSL